MYISILSDYPCLEVARVRYIWYVHVCYWFTPVRERACVRASCVLLEARARAGALFVRCTVESRMCVVLPRYMCDVMHGVL